MKISDYVKEKEGKRLEKTFKILKNSGDYQIVRVGYKEPTTGKEIVDKWEIRNSKNYELVTTYDFDYSISGHYSFPMDTMRIEATLADNVFLISKGGVKSGPGLPNRKHFILDLTTGKNIEAPVDDLAYLRMWDNKDSGIPGMMDSSDETLYALLKDGNVLLKDGRIFNASSKTITNFRTRPHLWNKNSLDEIKMQINKDINNGLNR